MKSFKNRFQLKSTYRPSGDQPKAIAELLERFDNQQREQVLLGVTGSGKTFTMAHVLSQLGVPTLVLAPNKTLAAQLYGEFKEFFPGNAVEYFVSYYDYYQPEAYIPSTDTYIEKDSAINEQIDRMRHSATRSLFDRRDVIIVSSVSCIYGLGSPEAYEGMMVHLQVNDEIRRNHLLKELIRILYKRNDFDFHRGTFRVRGDVVEIFPPYEEDHAVRVEFFGDFIESISIIDPLTGEIIRELDQMAIYPGSHYVSSEENTKKAIRTIQEELQVRLKDLRQNMKLAEAQRLEQRTYYDIEMMEELGFCNGVENYSRHFTGREPGAAPPTLLEYFPKDFLTIIDESHITVPQIGGMYRGDRARKTTLVEHGFRLPSALDNRPLNFQEFERSIGRVIYVSATPGPYELEKTKGLVTEQLIRPTGLVDPVVEIKPAKNQLDDLLSEVQKVIKKKQRILVTTLTKKSAEDLTRYYSEIGIKVKYLHSDIKTVERSELIRDLRLGVFDVLVGINLLREGLDLPEVSLVGITDADKEGFLRSERSLVQTIGRAARNVDGRVILYADHMTESIRKAVSETERRRELQQKYNEINNITPQTIYKIKTDSLAEIYEDIYGSEQASSVVSSRRLRYESAPDELAKEIGEIRKKMKEAAKKLEFEEAARLRDEIKRLELLQLEYQ